MAVGPDLPMALDPADGVVEPIGLQNARARLSGPGPRDEVSAFEHLEVLRDRLLGERERLLELVHRRVAFGQPLQDRPPGGIGQCREHLAQLVRGHCHGASIYTTGSLYNYLVVDVPTGRVTGQASGASPARSSAAPKASRSRSAAN